MAEKFVRLIREDEVDTYDGSYAVTENGTVSCANKMMTQDLTVNVESGVGGALSAGTDEEMAAYLTAKYEGCTVQYTGETGTYENGRYYMVAVGEV